MPIVILSLILNQKGRVISVDNQFLSHLKCLRLETKWALTLKGRGGQNPPTATLKACRVVSDEANLHVIFIWGV